MLLLALLLAPSVVHAQKKWIDIGTTAAGNHVFVDPKSVKRSGKSGPAWSMQSGEP